MSSYNLQTEEKQKYIFLSDFLSDFFSLSPKTPICSRNTPQMCPILNKIDAPEDIFNVWGLCIWRTRRIKLKIFDTSELFFRIIGTGVKVLSAKRVARFLNITEVLFVRLYTNRKKQIYIFILPCKLYYRIPLSFHLHSMHVNIVSFA